MLPLPDLPAPTLPAATGSGARALLLTLLGEFVLPAGGSIWTSAVIEGLATVGVEERSARQALACSATAGLLTSERRGRQARWSLTPVATRLLREGAERIYGFGREPVAWDGRWLLVVVTVPESNRALRYRLRVRLGWYGLAPLASGLWVTPHTERESDVSAVLEDLGLCDGAQTFVGRGGAVGDLEARAATVWDLATVEAGYESFVDTFARRRPVDDRETFAALLGVVHEWRQFPAADPALPERLLPRPWSGAEAARLFAARHAAWHDPAWRWWTSLDR